MTGVQRGDRATSLDERGARGEWGTGGVAARLGPALERLFPHGCPVRFVFWDASTFGSTDGPATVRFHSADTLARLIWSPSELGLARAYVSGEIDIEGDGAAVLRALHDAVSTSPRSLLTALAAAVRAARPLGALRRPPPLPASEIRLAGRRHSVRRDRRAIGHHYDIGNDFYRLVLGPSMTYSCARFAHPYASLEQAQRSKHELICRKLGLDEHRGARLLDVGCGWGSMAIHAAAEYGAQVVAITLSPAQAALARARVQEAGVGALVEVRLQDYRELRDESFDAISSIGMFEHVGTRRMQQYFETLRALLAPHGRLLNHAISRQGGSMMRGRKFVHRYVFPDGELIDVGDVVHAMERTGFEVRDVESLREHYTSTLSCWVRNLEQHWSEAVEAVGDERARVWWLYMNASANCFADGTLGLHQVLGVSPDASGVSAMPLTSSGWD